MSGEWSVINKSPTYGFRYSDIACSSDANYIFVTTLGSAYNTKCEVYRSGDGGNNWTTVLGPNDNGVFTSVACSDDGQYVFVTNSNGTTPHKSSSDYGVTWSNVTSVTPTRFTRFCAMSADGNYIVTGYENMDRRFGEKGLWTYRNGSWSLQENNSYKNFGNAAVSSNGQYSIVFSANRVGPAGYSRSDYSSTYGVYVSNNYMASWSQNTQVNSSTYDSGCAISSDGQYMAVAVIEGVYISSDYGSNWTLKLSMSNTSLGTASWNHNRPRDIAMSSDGMIMVLNTFEGYTYKSTDRGENWSVDNNVIRRWVAADMAPDGSKIVMSANPSGTTSNDGLLHIYTAALPSPGDGNRGFDINMFNYNIDFTNSGNFTTGSLISDMSAVTDASASACVWIDLSKLKHIFHFSNTVNSSEITNINFDISALHFASLFNISDNSILGNAQTEFTSNPRGGLNTKATDYRENVNGSEYSNEKRSIKYDFVRDLAQQLFGTYHAVDLFENETELLNSAYNSVNSIIPDNILSGITKTINDVSRNTYNSSSNTDIGSVLLRQMIEISDNLTLELDPSGSTTQNSDVSYYYMPFLNNDSIQFKLKINSEENQKNLIGSSGSTSRVYDMRLIATYRENLINYNNGNS